jgi:hypothetical protein
LRRLQVASHDFCKIALLSLAPLEILNHVQHETSNPASGVIRGDIRFQSGFLKSDASSRVLYSSKLHQPGIISISYSNRCKMLAYFTITCRVDIHCFDDNGFYFYLLMVAMTVYTVSQTQISPRFLPPCMYNLGGEREADCSAQLCLLFFSEDLSCSSQPHPEHESPTSRCPLAVAVVGVHPVQSWWSAHTASK